MAKSRKSLPKQQRRRGHARYRHSEVTRLLNGAIGAGLKVVGVEADAETGRLRVLVREGGEPSDSVNSWDEVLNAKDAKRSA
jgi:hypothetical protein